MGLEKAIESGKEHRKPYRGSKRFDLSCRNNNDCPWCKGNRLHSSKCREMASEEQLKQLEKYKKKWRLI